MTTWPSIANDALTPPNVGFGRMQTQSTPSSRSRPIDCAVFAICMSDRQPSCMRAPPEAVTSTRGVRVRAACSAAHVTRSPTAVPMLPPMNRKSMTARTTPSPPMAAVPMMTASCSPVVRRASANRCR